jgi:hypothetical protein
VQPGQLNLIDQVELLAGEFAGDVVDLLGGRVSPFVNASRFRRHAWLSMLDISTGAARSAIVRFGFEGRPSDQLDWVAARTSPMFCGVLRRCMPPTSLPRGSYKALHDHLYHRPRSGRVMCQVGQIDREGLAVVLALPPAIVERRVLELMNGDLDRAKAVTTLWEIALELGHAHPADLRAAICRAQDCAALESLLAKAVLARELPVAPTPDDPDIVPIRTAKELSSYGFQLQNCARSRVSFGIRERGRAFFMWIGDDPQGPAMISVSPDQLGWRLDEIRQKSNRRPPAYVLERIEAAFRPLGIRRRDDLAGMLFAI